MHIYKKKELPQKPQGKSCTVGVRGTNQPTQPPHKGNKKLKRKNEEEKDGRKREQQNEQSLKPKSLIATGVPLQSECSALAKRAPAPRMMSLFIMPGHTHAAAYTYTFCAQRERHARRAGTQSTLWKETKGCTKVNNCFYQRSGGACSASLHRYRQEIRRTEKSLVPSPHASTLKHTYTHTQRI